MIQKQPLDSLVESIIRVYQADQNRSGAFRCDRYLLGQSMMIEQRLNRLYRFACPQAADLIDWYAALLPPEEVYSLWQHVVTCLLCQEELTGWVEFQSDTEPKEEEILLTTTCF